jgi:hypothetical protein
MGGNLWSTDTTYRKGGGSSQMKASAIDEPDHFFFPNVLGPAAAPAEGNALA